MKLVAQVMTAAGFGLRAGLRYAGRRAAHLAWALFAPRVLAALAPSMMAGIQLFLADDALRRTVLDGVDLSDARTGAEIAASFDWLRAKMARGLSAEDRDRLVTFEQIILAEAAKQRGARGAQVN